MTFHLERVETMPDKLLEALVKLRLHTESGNLFFKEKMRSISKEHEVNASFLTDGLSMSNVKNMRRREACIPTTIPRLLVSFLFRETHIDVTRQQALAGFHQLGFDIQLRIDVETRNSENSSIDVHDLRNLFYEIHEFNATAEDPTNPDFELDLRIGFDRTRLTLHAEGLRSIGNRLVGEITRVPGEGADAGYTGWFKMLLTGEKPLNWSFSPKNEGDVLDGRVDAEILASVETRRGAALVAEITAKRDALKVRIVDENGRRASKSLSDQHRDKMCAAVARKSIAGAADEYLIHRVLLVRADERARRDDTKN
ncbi:MULTISPECIES: hypothetical protein [Rhizobium]|uniref:hypothetical protein n=1 Tax=Rhizobium TaxID=379 RepID=UPI001030E783|nr:MULTISPECIES: hypothetical protein [Rhizobium]TBF24860.1 hypothetical protein ELG88_33670 [Rhizobium leguminosarum]WSH48951.1 hypothetical protein U8P77_35225 [Rhizobium johnstonii]